MAYHTHRRRDERRGRGNLQEVLERLAVRVGGILDEVVERVPKASLSEHLECGARHPAVNVNSLPGILVHAFCDACTELHVLSATKDLRAKR